MSIPFSPEILFHCHLGTVEEYIDGREMTHQEMISPRYSEKIAIELRKFHDSGFIHMDLHHRNMIIDSNDRVRFVDFEFAESSDDIYKDIANHFCEYVYDYHSEEWYVPKHPQQIEQMMDSFLTHYLGNPPDPDFVSKMKEKTFEIDMKWIKWSLEYYHNTGLECYLLYAENRAKRDMAVFAQFEKQLSDLRLLLIYSAVR
jgi:thiamine kinase-like enzyme